MLSGLSDELSSVQSDEPQCRQTARQAPGEARLLSCLPTCTHRKGETPRCGELYVDEGGKQTDKKTDRQRETERETERNRERERLRENSNSKTLFHKDCSLGLVKNLSNKREKITQCKREGQRGQKGGKRERVMNSIQTIKNKETIYSN